MKKIILPLAVLLAGTAVGGGAAYGTSILVGPKHERAQAKQEEDVETSFTPTTKLIAPLVTGDGRLAGYVQFDLQLEVSAKEAEKVTARMPLLLHAINMRTYRTPMAAGPDGMIPDLGTFRQVVMDASAEAFGPKVVKRAAITQAVPA